jgi:hypothetical protein
MMNYYIILSSYNVCPDDNVSDSYLVRTTKLGSIAMSNCCVAQKSDFEDIFISLGSTKRSDDDGYTYDKNVNAYFKDGFGGKEFWGSYWAATE